MHKLLKTGYEICAANARRKKIKSVYIRDEQMQQLELMQI